MNEGGTKTLEYLRTEKDLLQDREQLAVAKKKFEDLNLAYWMTGVNEKRMERFWKVVSLLQENSRMSLCEMSKKLKIPVSTLYDMIKEVEKIFHFTIVLKDDKRKAPIRDSVPFGFAHQALMDMNAEETTPPYLNAE